MLKKVQKKICLLGEPGVGKTSLIRRYVYNIYDDKYLSTIGVKVSRKMVVLKDFLQKPFLKIQLGLQIWDLVGQAGFQSVQDRAYQGTNGAILVGDLSRPFTLERMELFMGALRKESPRVRVLFIGNKKDLMSSLPLEMKQTLEELTGKYEAEYLLTSAKSGEGVEEAFLALGRMLTTEFFM